MRDAVTVHRDMIGIGAEVIFAAVVFDHLQPGLLGELIKAGGGA